MVNTYADIAEQRPDVGNPSQTSIRPMFRFSAGIINSFYCLVPVWSLHPPTFLVVMKVFTPKLPLIPPPEMHCGECSSFVLHMSEKGLY